ncbi:hypothetical protein MA16_Dca006217 [Dendrobium catenatum]|uniref:Uncharacterized protein n=1 Tax=Dendrobium catenatum TaxID=906689 RepID=A0A2I0X4S4_9ASPA|nr:hypothetical protein MA16_Dca006217 [Dendrobium catenatum]
MEKVGEEQVAGLTPDLVQNLKSTICWADLVEVEDNNLTHNLESENALYGVLYFSVWMLQSNLFVAVVVQLVMNVSYDGNVNFAKSIFFCCSPSLTFLVWYAGDVSAHLAGVLSFFDLDYLLSEKLGWMVPKVRCQNVFSCHCGNSGEVSWRTSWFMLLRVGSNADVTTDGSQFLAGKLAETVEGEVAEKDNSGLEAIWEEEVAEEGEIVDKELGSKGYLDLPAHEEPDEYAFVRTKFLQRTFHPGMNMDFI